MTRLKSISYDELEVGTTGSFSKTLGEREIVLYAETSGDNNPLHFDEDYAGQTDVQGTYRAWHVVSGVDIYLHRHCHAGAWQYLYGAGTRV